MGDVNLDEANQHTWRAIVNRDIWRSIANHSDAKTSTALAMAYRAARDGVADNDTWHSKTALPSAVRAFCERLPDEAARRVLAQCALWPTSHLRRPEFIKAIRALAHVSLSLSRDEMCIDDTDLAEAGEALKAFDAPYPTTTDMKREQARKSLAILHYQDGEDEYLRVLL